MRPGKQREVITLKRVQHRSKDKGQKQGTDNRNEYTKTERKEHPKKSQVEEEELNKFSVVSDNQTASKKKMVKQLTNMCNN